MIMIIFYVIYMKISCKTWLQYCFFSFLYPELAQLTGVAAILRFPMPELEDSDDDDDEDGAAGGNDSDSD